MTAALFSRRAFLGAPLDTPMRDLDVPQGKSFDGRLCPSVRCRLFDVVHYDDVDGSVVRPEPQSQLFQGPSQRDSGGIIVDFVTQDGSHRRADSGWRQEDFELVEAA